MSALWANLTDRWSSLDSRGRAITGAAALAVVILLAVILFAVCGGGGEPVAATTTTTTPPPSTAPPPTTTTTTLPPTTTTVPAEITVVLAGAPDDEFTAMVTDVYRFAAGEPAAGETLDPGLAAHLTAVVPAEVPFEQAGDAAWAFLRSGERVGVAQVGDDVILAVDEGVGWQAVGARLDSAGAAPWYGEEPRHVLIIGSDARWNEDMFGARSDSLHVLAAAPSEGKAVIVGIPRDAWVPSAVGGTGKITNFLAAGGPDAVFLTVQNLTGLPLEGWIITGFLGFEVIVNDFGGLVVDLPRPVRGGLPGFPNYPAGTQELDGPTALLLARIRKTLPRGDFDRSFNHGIIMQSALLQVQDRGILDLPLLLSILTESSHDSLTAAQLLTLGAIAYELDPAEVDNLVLPGRTGSVGAASVVFLDNSGAAAIWSDIADGKLDEGSE